MYLHTLFTGERDSINNNVFQTKHYPYPNPKTNELIGNVVHLIYLHYLLIKFSKEPDN